MGKKEKQDKKDARKENARRKESNKPAASKQSSSSSSSKGGKKNLKVKPYSFKPKKQHLQKNREEFIEYDDTRRQDYLTGFHKRKLEKIKAAKARDAKIERDEKREARKEKRSKLSEVKDDVEHIEAIAESRRLAKLAESNQEEEEDIYSEDFDASIRGPAVASKVSALSSKRVEKKAVAGGKKIVTVTIEDFEM
ncbi:hypothetical protein HK100_012643 [Physocladia obscura]|uniref:Ribosomal RNA-processing protein 17 n=1 Tax=Physocladia obscura TaxID=109957 RepID=A0AAD5T175_9FUNG|nr:hypothetical protein HK100_012643 [Physocladia obscura]